MNEEVRTASVDVDVTLIEPVLPFGGLPVELTDETQDDPAPEFLEYVIDQWRKSTKYQTMLSAERYLKNKNDIRSRKRTAIGAGGQRVEVENLANNKLSHPFLRKLTKQKVNYLLANPPVITSESEELQDAMQGALTKGFLRDLKNATVNAITQSIGWLQAYYDEAGELRFKRIPAPEVIPFWSDVDHTKLVAAIRVYDYVRFDNSTPTVIERVQYFTKRSLQLRASKRQDPP